MSSYVVDTRGTINYVIAAASQNKGGTKDYTQGSGSDQTCLQQGKDSKGTPYAEGINVTSLLIRHINNCLLTLFLFAEKKYVIHFFSERI